MAADKYTQKHVTRPNFIGLLKMETVCNTSVGIKSGGGDGHIIKPQHISTHHYGALVLVQHVATKANVDLVLDDVKACGHALLPDADVHLRIVNSTWQNS